MDGAHELDAPDGEKEVSQAVKVAVHIRPLILQERIQGCKECISVVAGGPQVQLGSHGFTFDHVYGSNALPPSEIFQECVAPLVEGLFHGYNATVLAYGQTGSGKTYTMGTGGNVKGIIGRVMETLFAKIEKLKGSAEFQLRVSFIEILKEEIHDLLDPSPSQPVKPEPLGGAFGIRPVSPGKPPILIRETISGGITLSSVTEVDVSSLQEMASCLEQGSLARATGSTNMNSRSSRSHAIFTINMEHRQRGNITNGLEEFLCAKLHLVDLAGSERAKRTGTDGLRFKEGIHINRGLLALGNVISALGDDRKRKEGSHVPYRDSKLTRLLQDSLGGNSRTVMIACVSPADSNAEETLNTLKYANRARNIQNKPIVNRDPTAAEIQRLRQQVEMLQGQLCAQGTQSSSDEFQILKQKMEWMEATNSELREELQRCRDEFEALSLHGQARGLDGDSESERPLIERPVPYNSLLKNYRTRIHQLEAELQHFKEQPQPMSTEDTSSCDLSEIDTQAKELEHNMLQNCLDKELQELDKQLAQKEAEMKNYRSDPIVLKQHFEKKLVELEEEKKELQQERDVLLTELENVATTSDEQTQKMQDSYLQKLKQLEYQICELKKKQDSQTNLLKQKQRTEEASKRLHEEIHRIKQQKVQLHNKIKQESEQFRAWKCAREKELLQLKKEGRRNEFEMHKLRALHQHQKMVLQRKTEEAAVATRRLKEVIEARKCSSMRAGSGEYNTSCAQIDQQWLDRELDVAVHVQKVRIAYGKQSDARVGLANELSKLRSQVDEQMDLSKHAQINLVESMLTATSDALIAMGSQLSEAEEREQSCGRWQQVRNVADAKHLLQLAFDAAAVARCELEEKKIECRELKKRNADLSDGLRESEACRTLALAAATKASADVAVRCGMEKLSLGISELAENGSTHFIAKVVVDGGGRDGGKLWKWKKKNKQQLQQQKWPSHLKWKWQKPWRQPEWSTGKGSTAYKFRQRHT